MVWSDEMKAERARELKEANWATVRSAERKAEIDEWVTKVEALEKACDETRDAVGRMCRWCEGWTPADGWQAEVERGREVVRLSELSFKAAIPGLVRQVDEMSLEESKLYRRRDVEQCRLSVWGGTWWYNASFDTKDAKVLRACLDIQQGLATVRFFVDLWRALFPEVYADENERWEVYDGAMQSVQRLVFMSKEEEAETNAAWAARAFEDLSLEKRAQLARMRGLLGELRGLGWA
jgi:hypothetical protein